MPRIDGVLNLAKSFPGNSHRAAGVRGAAPRAARG